MKKLFKLSIAVFTVLSIASCKKEESGVLSGTVTLDGSATPGAVVIVSKAPLAADVLGRVVADETGSYSIGLDNGTYYLTAQYDPSNTNLKSTGNITLTSAEQKVSVEGDATADLSLDGVLSGGDAAISLTDGWSYDNTHTTIGFEFPYDQENAIFTGHFANADIDILEFDESAPENAKIRAWVDVTSIETGSHADACGHGRDGIHGCIAGTFGVDIDATDTITVYCEDGTPVTNWPNDTTRVSESIWTDGTATSYMRPSAIIGTTGVATFSVDGLEAHGMGYVGTATFTFAGSSADVPIYLTYIEGYQGEDRSGNAIAYSSFYGEFSFPAKSAFGIESGHVGDADVTVNLSIQLNKAL